MFFCILSNIRQNRESVTLVHDTSNIQQVVIIIIHIPKQPAIIIESTGLVIKIGEIYKSFEPGYRSKPNHWALTITLLDQIS